MKQMKTAAALRASDTSFLQQDSMPKLIEEIIKPKQSPVQEAALRAADRIEFVCFEHSGNYQGISSNEASAMIAAEFAFVDELVECLGACLDGSLYWHHGSCAAKDNISDCDCWVGKSRALLERIEKVKK